MQLKNSGRGIQQKDVWKAADELLQEGQRPTIERIRLKIGRGSPNTISPMLENWFAALGNRINGTTFSQDSALAAPEPVEQAIRHAWALALEQATEISNQAVKTQYEENVSARKLLEDEKQAFEQEKRLHEATLQEQEKRLDNVTAQLHDVKSMLAQRNREYENQAQEVGRLKIQIADLLTEQKERQALAEQNLENLNQQHAKEREALESRFRSLELRSVSEIDRARQETRQLQQKLEQSLKTHNDNEKARKTQREEAREKHQQLSQRHEANLLNLQATQEENRLLLLKLKQLQLQKAHDESQYEQQIMQLTKENKTLSSAISQQQENQLLQQEMSRLLEKLNTFTMANIEKPNKKTLE